MPTSNRRYKTHRIVSLELRIIYLATSELENNDRLAECRQQPKQLQLVARVRNRRAVLRLPFHLIVDTAREDDEIGGGGSVDGGLEARGAVALNAVGADLVRNVEPSSDQSIKGRYKVWWCTKVVTLHVCGCVALRTNKGDVRVRLHRQWQ